MTDHEHAVHVAVVAGWISGSMESSTAAFRPSVAGPTPSARRLRARLSLARDGHWRRGEGRTTRHARDGGASGPPVGVRLTGILPQFLALDLYPGLLGAGLDSPSISPSP